MERSYSFRWWKNLNQYHIKQSRLWSKEKKEIKGVERAEDAEGAAR